MPHSRNAPLQATVLPDGCTRYQLDERGSALEFWGEWLSPADADALLAHMLSPALDWRSVSSRHGTLPRLQCWMSDAGVSAQLFQREAALPWSPEVAAVKTRLESTLRRHFDYVLLNHYRDGHDRISWHRDDEADEEGKDVIASISLGATRTFGVKRKSAKAAQLALPLTHGSLVIMRGRTMQNEWVHCVPEEPSVLTPRINLTFRTS